MLQILVLQHPQEPGIDTGSLPLLEQTLGAERVQTRVGLSWRNLGHALRLKPEQTAKLQPKSWLVLYWGSGPKTAPGAPPAATNPTQPQAKSRLLELDRKGAVRAPKQTALDPPIQGVILLDGTWSQAKSLWWRNAWLLKLRRGVILPARPSLYGVVRREPRKECLSTLETVAELLELLDHDTETAAQLRDQFKAFVAGKKRSPSSG